MSALLDAAFGYIESSPQWPIFPASSRTKHEIICTGRDHAEHASTDAAQIERWLTRDFPHCDAIGMPTGIASGTVVIDCDRKHDGELLLAVLELALCPLPRDRVVRTQSGGLHIYLAHPGNGIRVKTSQGADSPLGRLLGGRAGIDVRADGGIVILPPSCGYQWIADDDERPPPLPALWLAAIQGAGDPPPPPRRPMRAARSGDRKWCSPDRVHAISEGGRNGELWKRGVALRLAGASDAEILDDLEQVNAMKCSPPLPAREVAAIAKKAATRAVGRRS